MVFRSKTVQTVSGVVALLTCLCHIVPIILLRFVPPSMPSKSSRNQAGRCAPAGLPERRHLTFCISFPQQQRGLRSPPDPGFAPFVTWISHAQFESGQRYSSPCCNAISLPPMKWTTCASLALARAAAVTTACSRLIAPTLTVGAPTATRLVRDRDNHGWFSSRLRDTPNLRL